MIRHFVYALILILSAYAAAAAQDSALATTSPTPNPPSTEKITFTEVNVDGPYIAMTFDDGPHATNTPKLLEMAAEKHIKLTFFGNWQLHPAEPRRAPPRGRRRT